MSVQTTELTQKTQDLICVLERDIEHIERTASHLNKLRGLVIKRDEQGLSQLFEGIKKEVQEYSANERHRLLIREQLAGLLGCRTNELTLSVLVKRIGEPAKTAVAMSREKLKALVGHLQREYASTVALLTDCARINSMLLKIIFERSRRGPVCYDSTGVTSRESDAAFMSMRL